MQYLKNTDMKRGDKVVCVKNPSNQGTRTVGNNKVAYDLHAGDPYLVLSVVWPFATMEHARWRSGPTTFDLRTARFQACNEDFWNAHADKTDENKDRLNERVIALEKEADELDEEGQRLNAELAKANADVKKFRAVSIARQGELEKERESRKYYMEDRDRVQGERDKARGELQLSKNTCASLQKKEREQAEKIAQLERLLNDEKALNAQLCEQNNRLKARTPMVIVISDND